MKASVLHEYGGPSNLKYQDVPDPQPGPGEVRVRVLALSVNPVDWKMRSGEAKERFPVDFPGILGRDLAGIVESLGEGVTTLQEGDKVFGLAHQTYAEFCIVKADELAKIPDGLDMVTAGSVPLVSLTGHQLVHKGTKVKPGGTILITGLTGSVGRCALFAAQQAGATVIAGVRKKQKEEALALGAKDAIDIDSEDEVARLGLLDGVADTVGGKIGSRLLGKVKQGGTFGSVLGPPQDAALHPTVEVNAIMAQPDPATVIQYGEAIRDGKLKLPIERTLPLSEAPEAQAMAEKGGVGKIVLTP